MSYATQQVHSWVQIKICTWMFITTSFIIAPNWKLPKCASTGEWITKLRAHPNNQIPLYRKGINYQEQQHGWISIVLSRRHQDLGWRRLLWKGMGTIQVSETQMWKINVWTPRVGSEGRDELGDWDWHIWGLTGWIILCSQFMHCAISCPFFSSIHL